MAQKLVVIGAGMASGRVLEHLTDADADLDITLFNAESRGNYNRIMLSPVLSGEKSYQEIITHDANWYETRGITCRFDEHVTAINPNTKTVTGENGTVPYDKLLLATGSAPFILPVPGHDLPGVITFRDLDDVQAMQTAARKGGHAVVIGGGLLGLEAAAGLKAQGMDVTVLHLMGHLMERQLDEAAGYLLRKSLEEKGISIRLNAATKVILGKTKVDAVLLESGDVIGADLVVMAAGIRPETRLATDAGLAVERGIDVNAQMLTSDPNILAVGECVEFDGLLFGLVAPLYDQAKVAAETLMGKQSTYVARDVSTKLKVTGCDLFSAGDFAEGKRREDIVFRDPARGIYKRLVIEDERLVGAVLYGDTTDGGYFFSLIQDGKSIADQRDTLIFGPGFAGGTATDPLAAVAALPDDAEICGCNGVCKSTIIAAVQAGATTLADIKAQTKASTSCGTCTGLVEQVMAITLGDEFQAGAEAPICSCTGLTHEDARRLIKARELKSQAAVWQELGWNTTNGCHICRPAINYYLLSDWPVEYQDDPQSRYVNERNHANIQQDGTYSVVPRMFGGRTTPDELRAIADVVDRYEIPTVKVTGGQRIDLLGVKKPDLPAVWRDLNAAGMVSGHAYAKGLRTVKTCVGTEHCHVATQDSMGLGVRLEKLLWGTWTPHKLKVAVSGCPRNCAEATCKDLGVICVDSGYEISVAGAAGMDVKETEPLAKVKTEAEVLEYSAAFIQLYREGAKYLDRPYKWIAKVGMDQVREQVSNSKTRAAAFKRFKLSQSVYQHDPWAKLAEKEENRFSPMEIPSLEAAE